VVARRCVVPTAFLTAAVLLAGCAQQGVSTQGQDIHDLYVRIALLAAPVFVGVEAFLLWCVVRYRRRDDRPAPQDAGSGRTLAVFFAIPTVIVAALFPFGEQTLGYVQQRDKNPGVIINVDAFQWEWTFTYTNEGLVESGKTLVKPAVMEVPVGQTIHIHLKSRDVVHEFYVPALLFMRNAIPGYPNDFDFTPTKLGTFPGQCAEFCGLWHSKMTFVLKVVSPPDYAAWIQSEKAAALNVSCPTGPPAVQLVAQNTSWNTACVAVPPDRPWSVTVTNKDAGIEHTFGVFDSSTEGVRYFLSPPVPGPTVATFQLPPLRPGRYYFECTIHGPSMSGTLIVK
jgi:cytochrome c oxidase subunit II